VTTFARSLSLGIVPALGVVLIGAGLTNLNDPPRGSHVTRITADRRKHWECDLHKRFAIPIYSPILGRDTTIDTIPDVGVISTVPEFHDCQRFIVFRGITAVGYDSVYAIWAVLKLPKLWRNLAALDSSGGNEAPRALLAAVILSIGGNYRELGIRHGFNCVYLHSSASPKAKVVSIGPSVADCADTVPVSLGGDTVTNLAVKREQIRGLKVNDYPPVARWEWNDRTRKQFIGVMCDAWCFIGPSGVVSARSYPRTDRADLLAATPTAKRRVTEAWGWFDEQKLAVPPWGVPGGVAPSTTLGTIFPDSGLYRYRQADFVSTWVHAASVSLSEDNAHYRARMNFVSERTSVPLGERLTTIELCKGECKGVPATLGSTCNWPSTDPEPTSSDRWWARIISARQDTVFKCVVRRDHSDLKDENGHPINVPATARWHWVLGDETTWKRCDNGCCDIIQ
jgi:hypothetical protein